MGTKRKNWTTERMLDIQRRIIEALDTKNLVLNDLGDIVPKATLQALGIIPTKLTVGFLKDQAGARGMRLYGWYVIEVAGERIVGMPYGPKTKHMDIEETKVPAVYEVVCAANGKRYVGTSKRPDLRRSVHLYWLRHINKTGTSNIFGKTAEIVEDVEKYGFEAFYMEIVKQVPSGDRQELKDAEAAYMAEVEDKLYNVHRTHQKLVKYRYRHTNPDWQTAKRLCEEARALHVSTKRVGVDPSRRPRPAKERWQYQVALWVLRKANALRRKHPRIVTKCVDITSGKEIPAERRPSFVSRSKKWYQAD